MRYLKGMSCCLLMILLCAQSYAFTASYVQTTSGTGVVNPQTKVVKIKDNKVRMEMESRYGKAITIIDGKTIYSYVPSKNKAVKLKSNASYGMEVLADYKAYLRRLDAKIVGSQTIDARQCDIYEYTDPRIKMPSKVWLWKEKGFPIKVETQVPDGTVTTVMSDVEVGVPIDDSLFVLPPGVEIVEAGKKGDR